MPSKGYFILNKCSLRVISEETVFEYMVFSLYLFAQVNVYTFPGGGISYEIFIKILIIIRFYKRVILCK